MIAQAPQKGVVLDSCGRQCLEGMAHSPGYSEDNYPVQLGTPAPYERQGTTGDRVLERWREMQRQRRLETSFERRERVWREEGK